MRTAIKTTDVYTFSELDDKAKEKAREWYRQGAFDYEWWNDVYQCATDAGRILGIEIDDKRKGQPSIYFSGFYHQGSGSSFVGSYRYAKGAAKAIRAEFPTDETLHKIADRLQALQRGVFYSATADISTGRGYGGDTRISVNVECERVQYSGLFLDIERELTDILGDFNHWIYSSLEREYEWLNSDEQIDESLIANEYEFTAEGDIY